MKNPKNIEIPDDDFDVELLRNRDLALKYLAFYTDGPDGFGKKLAVGAALQVLEKLNGLDAPSVLRAYAVDPEVIADLERRDSVNPNLVGQYPSRRKGKR